MAAPNSSSSSSSGFPDLLSNIHNLLPFKLDAINYSSWRYLIITILRAYNLVGYLDGSIKCPDKFLRVENDGGESSATRSTPTEINPSYEIWCMEDLRVMLFINATLSAEALVEMHVTYPKTSRELWLYLRQLHSRYKPEWFHLLNFIHVHQKLYNMSLLFC